MHTHTREHVNNATPLDLYGREQRVTDNTRLLYSGPPQVVDGQYYRVSSDMGKKISKLRPDDIAELTARTHCKSTLYGLAHTVCNTQPSSFCYRTLATCCECIIMGYIYIYM